MSSTIPQINSTIILKEKKPDLNNFSIYCVDEDEQITPLKQNIEKEYRIFVNSHYSFHQSFDSKNKDKIYKIEKYEFKMEYGLIYFKEIIKNIWNTIIVANNNIVEKFIDDNLPFGNSNNPVWMHGLDESNFNESRNLARRSISTYGKIEHQPNYSVYDIYKNEYSKPYEYIVVNVSNIVPNQKPLFLGKTKNTYIHLEPKNGLSDDEEVFWFVDYTNKTICQFEDGAILVKLESIEII